jgi:diguanylate cyclase (GGDEF)-like protein
MKTSLIAEMVSRHFEDRFIHASVHANRDALYRARILVCMLLMAAVILVVVVGILWWTPQDFKKFILPTNIASLVAIWALLCVLKRYGQVGLCSLLAVLVALAAIGFVITLTGGPYYSSARQLLFLPCLLSFLLGGIRLGAITLLICLIMLVGMLTAQISGHEFPQLSDTAQRESGHITLLVINFLIISAMAFAYEYTSIALKRERDQEYQKYIELAHKDPLTGLSNRRIFDDALHSRLELYERMPSNPCFALCYLDLDKFKPINDTHGHDVGDEVLSVVSNRLLSALRGADFIGRHGGDEFMMVFDGVQSTESIEALGARLLQLIREPIATRAGQLTIDGSLGFAVYPTHGRDATTLKTVTDGAMYEAKRTQAGFHIHPS